MYATVAELQVLFCFFSHICFKDCEILSFCADKSNEPSKLKILKMFEKILFLIVLHACIIGTASDQLSGSAVMQSSSKMLT